MVKNLIVGTIDKFAIEWTEESKVSPVRLWIEGSYIGTLEDSQSLVVFNHQLQRINKELSGLSYSKMELVSDNEVFNKLLADESGKHIVSLGDAFDDFCIFVYSSDDYLFIVWRLEPEPFFSYPGYGEEVKSRSISILEFQNVLSNFQKAIDDI